MTEPRLQPRRIDQLRAYAEGGVQAIDPVAVASAAMRARRPWVMARSRWLVPVLLGLILAALTAGALFVGSQPDPDPTVVMPVIVAPTPTDPPVEAPVPEDEEPSDVSVDLGINVAVGAGPCAAMVQRLMTYGTSDGALDDQTAALPAPERDDSVTNGDLLVTMLSERGEVVAGVLDTSRVPLELITSATFARVPGHFPGFLIHDQSRIVASPDGAAVAVEEGDLGPAGCGDPLVVPVGGYLRRPFASGSFELVTDLAWAPDGSALYGVRRPTIDVDGRPFADEDSGATGAGPGTVVRWDTTTGAVSELGSPCAGCRIDGIVVSPDGERLAANQRESARRVGSIVVREPDGTWRTVARDTPVVGWADDETLVLRGDEISLVSVDGTLVHRWDEPCCHGTGYAALLSPDGTTLAGMTLSDDFLSSRVTLVDVRDGTQRDVWDTQDQPSCEEYDEGSTDRLWCESTSGQPASARALRGRVASGFSRLVAWAPDGTAVVVLDHRPDSSDATIRVVQTDGSGATPPVTIRVPDLTESLGWPNVGAAVAWLAAPP